jgi:flagellar biosynthesis protein FlhF
MNIQRFTAPTSREAMARARNAFGDTAVILSTRSTEAGFEVMAAAEDSLATLAATAQGGAARPAAAPRGQAPAAAAAPAADSVEDDTEALAMSTLSFQEYVRERMLRKRREALGMAPEPLAAPVAAAQRPAPAPAATAQVPPPIRTRPVAPPAWDDTPAPRAPSRLQAPAAPAAAPARDSAVASELSALKELMEERFNTLAWLGTARQSPVQSGLMLKLIRAGYSPAMSRAVLERLPAGAAAPEAVRWVLEVLGRNLRAAGPGEGLCEQGGVVALVGPTGVGKTTTAAKLAAQCVQQHGPGSVGLITLDTYRVAGFEQLRAYGRKLGVVAHQAHDRAALGDLLHLLGGKRLVIIDTAGLGQRDERIQDMLDMLDMPQIRKTLVLNASAHGDTLDDVLTAFKASALHGGVLSKVDEAVKLGPAIDALIRHQVVLRGVANGQRVPEDWHAPDAAALVRTSMGSEGKSAFDPLGTDMGFYFSQASVRGIDLGSAHV